MQHDIDHDFAVEQIIAKAEEESKVTSFSAGRMKQKPKEIRKNRKAEAEYLRDKEKELKQSVAGDQEKRETPAKKRESSSNESRYSSIFAKFDDEEDDE